MKLMTFVKTSLLFMTFLLFPPSSAYANGGAFTETFESGIGSWWADNGVWEVGIPTSGPENCHSGEQCAATVLGGNYPTFTNSCLISPSIELPLLPPNEEMHIRFWHWHSIAFFDLCFVKVSLYDRNDKTWSEWITIGDGITKTGPVWSQNSREITNYAGNRIRMAFCLTQTGTSSDVSSGWYIDDIQIIAGQGLWILTSDSDNDGVPDNIDQCPNTLPGSCVNNVGCSESAVYTQDQVDKIVNDILNWGDMDGDGKIGLAEAIIALQRLSGLRNP